MNKILTYIASAAILLGATSCEDFFDLRPSNKMIIDDYWQNEDDVLNVTAAAYNTMCGDGFMQRLILWSEFRSDNCLMSTADNGNISAFARLTLAPSNDYARWGEFYRVINYCNTVEAFAPQVCDVSPTFTRAMLNAYIAEVRGIKAWCYFTLVRTFRDIPFVTEPTIDDDIEFEMAQSDPDEILDRLIEELEEVVDQAQTSYTSTTYLRGRMTQNAIRTLLADMLLWRGRYAESVHYCNLVLNDANNPLRLVPGLNYFRNVFVTGTSTETIFELNFNGNTQGNNATKWLYARTDVGGSRYIGANTRLHELFDSDKDVRKYCSFEFHGDNDASRDIVKYTGQCTNPTTSNRGYSYFSDTENRNWVVYRLSDVYLIKAEAMAEDMSIPGASFEAIAELCNKTYQRANYEDNSIELPVPGNQEEAREMVFDERQREFLFEGKRYFDILRRIKHHPEEFSKMVAVLQPRYVLEKVENSTINARLISVDALYMPIHSEELKVNTLLRQNPFYKTSSNIEKN